MIRPIFERFRISTFTCCIARSKKLKIKNNIVVGFSGTFGFWHGIDVLEKAIKLINKSNIECYFLMIGDRKA